MFFMTGYLHAQKKVSYGGFLEVGGQWEHKDIYVESYYKTKLEFKLKINDFTKVELDIRTNSEKRTFDIYEASAGFKLNSRLELSVGDLKKRFGLEEQVSRENLSTIKESMTNDYLKILGYAGRETGIAGLEKRSTCPD